MNFKLFILTLILISFTLVKAEEAGEHAHVFVSVYRVDLKLEVEKKDYWCPGETVHINSTLQNVGNMNVTGNLTTKIFNESMSVFLKEWKNQEIFTGEEKSYLANYTIKLEDGTGNFKVMSNFTYPQNSTQAEEYIRVSQGIGTLKASPGSIKDSIRVGGSKKYEILIWLEKPCNYTFAELNASVDPLEASFSSSRLLLRYSNHTNVTIRVPTGVKAGVYDNGTILINAYDPVREKTLHTYIRLNITVLPITATTVPAAAPARRAPAIVPIHAITLNVSTHTLTAVLGNKTSFLAYVKNVGTETVNAVKISVNGIYSDWISVTPSLADVEPNKTQEYLVTITIPGNAKTGIYRFKVLATDLVKSNEEIMTLIVGKNYKEICDLLLQEVDRVRSEANTTLLIGKCMDVSMLRALFNDGEVALNNGKFQYQSESYQKAIDWFEYTLSTYKKVISKADILIRMEIETSKKSEFLIPPFYDAEQQFDLAENYLREKNYEKICEPIEKIRGYILYGMIFYVGILLIFLVVLVVVIFFKRRKKEEKREEIVERIRERLRESSSTTSTP